MCEWTCSPSSFTPAQPRTNPIRLGAVERPPAHVAARRQGADHLTIDPLTTPGRLDHLVDRIGVIDAGKRPELDARAACRGAGELPGVRHGGERNNAETRADGAGLRQDQWLSVAAIRRREGKLLPLDIVEVAALLPLPERDRGSDAPRGSPST